jgi:fructuronate reductase
MGDETLKSLIERIGYVEGLPVVDDPGIFKPADFLKEVLEERFPNPYIPDTPQRIATDTSQKMSIRFGETIKSYMNAPNLNVSDLTGIPLAIAAWFRYLLGVDDKLRPMTVSDDPMLQALQKGLSGVEAGRPESYGGQLEPFLADESIFAIDLHKAGLAKKVEAYFISMLQGPDAVRRTLEKNLEKNSEARPNGV